MRPVCRSAVQGLVFMECEICGSEESGYVILVEGARLSVCEACSSSGRLISSPPRQSRAEAGAQSQKSELEVVENYGQLIAGARKRLGLPIDVLAERLNEKRSFLDRVEKEKTLPDEKLARKLERELGIRLLQEYFEGASAASNPAKGGMTLGDVLEIDRKKIDRKKKDKG